ncbi:hypothetical protein [Seohaeicola sp.]|uniref:hypothetical protein n=1 Tax=Seohaeicola sp. TaxID=2042026 RepID=UPI003A87DE37
MLLAICAHSTVSFAPSVSLLTKTSKLSHRGASKPAAAIKKDLTMNKPSDLTEILGLASSLCNLIDALIQLFPEGVSEEFNEDVF